MKFYNMLQPACRAGSYAAIAMGLALAGCSNEPEAVSSQNSVTEKQITAGDVLKLFDEAGLKVVGMRTITEADDENHLLGRPGQYTSKVNFYDARHPADANGAEQGQNTVEVFASEEDARSRHAYVETVTKNMPMLMQYQVLKGRVLARFDKVLLPSEVKQYEAALAKLD